MYCNLLLKLNERQGHEVSKYLIVRNDGHESELVIPNVFVTDVVSLVVFLQRKCAV